MLTDLSILLGATDDDDGCCSLDNDDGSDAVGGVAVGGRSMEAADDK